MFEDFWLQTKNDTAKIPVVTRLAGLNAPFEMAEIQVAGEIEHSTLEGGFYYLNASAWLLKLKVNSAFSHGLDKPARCDNPNS
jgi:hypothetical protein